MHLHTYIEQYTFNCSMHCIAIMLQTLLSCYGKMKENKTLLSDEPGSEKRRVRKRCPYYREDEEMALSYLEPTVSYLTVWQIITSSKYSSYSRDWEENRR